MNITEFIKSHKELNELPCFTKVQRRTQHRQPTKIDGGNFRVLPFGVCKYTERTRTENLPLND